MDFGSILAGIIVFAVVGGAAYYVIDKRKTSKDAGKGSGSGGDIKKMK